jgi:hypothetical protein
LREEDDALFAEMLRVAERVLDHQVKAIEALDLKTQNAITLGVAALGGGLALGSLVTAQGRAGVDVWFAGVFGAGGLLNLAALALLIDANTGLRRQRFVRYGVHVSWLRESWPDGSLRELRRSMVREIEDYAISNAHVMRAIASRRRQGLLVGFAAVTAYALALVYIVARSVGT